MCFVLRASLGSGRRRRTPNVPPRHSGPFLPRCAAAAGCFERCRGPALTPRLVSPGFEPGYCGGLWTGCLDVPFRPWIDCAEPRSTCKSTNTPASRIIFDSFAHSFRCYLNDYSSATLKKGFSISSVPSVGDIKATCVPRHTTIPSVLVASVSLYGSCGSRNCSTVSSNTKFTSWS